jgi:hypothetical protein
LQCRKKKKKEKDEGLRMLIQVKKERGKEVVQKRRGKWCSNKLTCSWFIDFIPAADNSIYSGMQAQTQ